MCKNVTIHITQIIFFTFHRNVDLVQAQYPEGRK